MCHQLEILEDAMAFMKACALSDAGTYLICKDWKTEGKGSGRAKSHQGAEAAGKMGRETQPRSQG